MGKQNRQQTKAKQPVSRHPLFPAVVAIWFGALFGLGSLALRASLLEAIVLSTHIDALITAAAPPLGMTARILLALAMATIGGIIGGTIGRWIARPRQEVRERQRNAAKTAASHKAAPNYVDNPAFTPAAGGRRRVLAIAEDYEPEFVRDAAPLPGGPPQILDVNDFDLAEPEVAVAEPALMPLAVAMAPEPEHAELDLTGFSAPVSAAAVLEPTPPQESVIAPEPVASEAIPVSLGRLFDARLSLAPVEPAIEAEATHAGTYGLNPVVNAPTASNMFNAAASISPIVFDGPGSLTAPPLADEANEAAGDDGLAEAAITAPAAPVPAISQVPGIVDQLAATETGSAPGFALPVGNAARRITTAPLAELSPVELIERLALSLQARRGAGKVTAQAGVDSTAPATAQTGEAPAAPFPALNFLAAAALGQPAPPVSEPSPSTLPPTHMPMPMPAAMRPITLTNLDDEFDDDAGLLPPRSIIPAQPDSAATVADAAALPVDLAADTAQASVQDSLAELASRFAIPSSAPASAPPEVAMEEAETDEEVAEDSYSSLLDLNRPAPRAQFIRIDDAETDGAEIEPVVIFPGQGHVTGGRFSAPAPAPAMETAPTVAEPVASASADAPQPATVQPTPGRRFDAPSDAAAAPSGATNLAAVPAQVADPLETEQALRSALATLQRMSGAA